MAEIKSLRQSRFKRQLSKQKNKGASDTAPGDGGDRMDGMDRMDEAAIIFSRGSVRIRPRKQTERAAKKLLFGHAKFRIAA
jgi:hypothetical protein